MLEILWYFFGVFFFFDGEEIVPLRQILPSSSNHLRIGNFQLAFQKLVAMTKSKFIPQSLITATDHRP